MKWSWDQLWDFSMLTKTRNKVSKYCISNHRNSLIIFTAWSLFIGVLWKTYSQNINISLYECFCYAVSSLYQYTSRSHHIEAVPGTEWELNVLQHWGVNTLEIQNEKTWQDKNAFEVTCIIWKYILLTDSMEQNPSWQANSLSCSQEIPNILWTQMFITILKEATTRPYPG
jgi:hypothetical protein